MLQREHAFRALALGDVAADRDYKRPSLGEQRPPVKLGPAAAAVTAGEEALVDQARFACGDNIIELARNGFAGGRKHVLGALLQQFLPRIAQPRGESPPENSVKRNSSSCCQNLSEEIWLRPRKRASLSRRPFSARLRSVRSRMNAVNSTLVSVPVAVTASSTGISVPSARSAWSSSRLPRTVPSPVAR